MLLLVLLATEGLVFSDHPTHPLVIVVGTQSCGWGLWLLHWKNGDLGRSWSAFFGLKENYRQVTEGVYRRIQHPMSFSLLLIGVGQTLALPNYLAGTAPLVPMILLVAFRIPAGERMMIEEFDDEYEAFRNRTMRVIPALW